MEVDRGPLVDEINALSAPDPDNGIAQPRWLKLAWLEPHVPACAVLPRAGPAAAEDVKADLPPASTSIAASETRPATSTAPSGAPVPAPTPASHSYRVFLQAGAARDAAALEPLRDEAAGLGFRMTEPQSLRRPMQGPHVRFFEPEQAADATALAEFLTQRFASEGLVFDTRSAGRNYQNLPEDTLEVWIPDPPNALAQAGKPRPRATAPLPN
jgi:hypothetical protein